MAERVFFFFWQHAEVVCCFVHKVAQVMESMALAGGIFCFIFWRRLALRGSGLLL